MVRLSKMARKIHCSPVCFIFLLADQCYYIVNNMWIYIYISDTVETEYKLPLLPNSTASETFLYKSGTVRSAEWILILSSWFRASYFNVNKNPTRCNSMQIFIYCKATLHVSGVTAPIIRSTKNCNRSLRYRSYCKMQVLTRMNKQCVLAC